MRVFVAVLVLLAVFAAGCSGSKTPPPTSTPTDSGSGTNTPVSNGTTPRLAAPPVFIDEDCRGIESLVPVDMAAARALVPDGFTPIAFQTAFGGPSSPAGDPQAAFVVIAMHCEHVNGTLHAAGDDLLFAGLPVNAPTEISAGNDFLFVDGFAGALTAPTYQIGGFPVRVGSVENHLIFIAGAGEASAVGTSDGLAVSQQVAGQDGTPAAGFKGRFFAATDGVVTGILDFTFADGVGFGTAGSVVQVTAGDLMGQNRFAGAGSTMAAPTITMDFSQSPAFAVV
jgi:hypothetical protein